MNSIKEIRRSLKIELPKGQSAFLWGPRKTGKTTFLKEKFSKNTWIDLLDTELFFRYSQHPHQFREELLLLLSEKKLIQPVIVDEVQKVPALLDEVHLLIEKYKVSFILCGSSARKLKRGHANLLGGRAWRFELFPLTTYELKGKFDLLRSLNYGLIPPHYFSSKPELSLRSYVQDYLKEEILQEGLVRNLPAFSRFLEAAAFSNCELVNYSNIASECGVDTKTVISYFSILQDTFLGFLLEPYRKKRKREIIFSTPKFYFFDLGLASYLTKRKINILKGEEFGKAFEHFIFLEILAYRSYLEKDFSINYWRTKQGQEVDFVLDGGQVAIEVKGASHIHGSDLGGLKIFKEEHSPKQSILVCQEPRARLLDDGVKILPWKLFLEQLWAGKIL